MRDGALEQMLEAEFENGLLFIGEVMIRKLRTGGFEVTNRSGDFFSAAEFSANDALEIAKFEDSGRYRPLRTAPNLRRGWKMLAPDLAAAIAVIDAIYPGRLAAWCAWKSGKLTTTSLRVTLNRQSGVYRIAAKISDEQIDELVGNFCRSDDGCLRTILWRRDDAGAFPSNELVPEKFDPTFDQTGRGERCIPLPCQEACNLLVSACRDVVKGSGSSQEKRLSG